MAYGDLQTFLPRAEGQVLDVERAKAEGASRANYLSEMDQFYEGLEESARQFDITQALAERQFDWQSGFEERKLEQEATLEANRLEVEKLIAEGQVNYWQGQLALGKGELDIRRDEVGIMQSDFGLRSREQSFMKDYYTDQMTLERERFGLERQLAGQQPGSAITGPGGVSYNQPRSPVEKYYSRLRADTPSHSAFQRTSGYYASNQRYKLS